MNFTEYLLKTYGQTLSDKILDAQNKKRTSSLILNYNKYDLDILKDVELKKHPYVEHAFYFDGEKNKLGIDYRFENGAFYIQDAAAMMPVHMLGIEKDDIILDMCAAPGGKTIDAALKLNNSGMIIANDLSYERARTLSTNVERMGFANVIVTNNDLSKVYRNYPETFDKIILDAPCSGSFMFRKNELSKLDWTMEKVLACQNEQKTLLEMAAYMLKEGGKIVYSTCSLSPEENEEVIKNFLDNNAHFNLQEFHFENDVSESKILAKTYYFYPFAFNGEGQFVCVLVKTGENYKTTKKLLISEKYPGTAGIFNLQFSNYLSVKDSIYAFNQHIKINKFNVLRAGLLVANLKGKIEIPSFHLAHYINDPKFIIELNEAEFKKYLHGEEIEKSIKNGFYIVSYNKVNLGFVKAANERLKNYYPKGLRK